MNAANIHADSFSGLASRPFYTRVAALGFALIALTGLVYLSIALIGNSVGDAWDFTLTFMVVGVLVTVSLLRFGAWAQVLAAVLSFLALASVLPFTTRILMNPEDGADFIPLMFLLFGAVLGFAGSIAGLIQRRRHTMRITATRAESLGLKAVLVALAVLVISSLVLTVAARTPLPAEAKANSVSLDVKSYKFSPDQLRAKAGSTVKLVVKNEDATMHTFTLDAAGVDASLPPGAERLIEFQAPAPARISGTARPTRTQARTAGPGWSAALSCIESNGLIPGSRG